MLLLRSYISSVGVNDLAVYLVLPSSSAVDGGTGPHQGFGLGVQRKTLLQQIKIDAAICIAVENKPARISTLGHVVGSIDCDHTRQTSHGSIRIAAICRI
jgi:hypothetical protein